MRRLLIVLAVFAVISVLSIGSVAQIVELCTPTKTTISLYPGCRQLVQPGQQDCFVARVFEYYPIGIGPVDDAGVVFFIDNNTHTVLGTATLNTRGVAVGCFKIKHNVDVYAYFIGFLADGAPVLDTVGPLCSSYSQGIDVDVENNPALHGCGPSS